MEPASADGLDDANQMDVDDNNNAPKSMFDRRRRDPYANTVVIDVPIDPVRNDVVTAGQVVVLPVPDLTTITSQPANNAAADAPAPFLATWRWTRDGFVIPLDSTRRNGISSDQSRPAPLTVVGRPGLYRFEYYDSVLGAWMPMASWRLGLRTGPLLALSGARGAALVHSLSMGAFSGLAGAPSLWRHGLVTTTDTPRARWDRLAAQIAESRGQAMAFVYNNSAFYWLMGEYTKLAITAYQDGTKVKDLENKVKSFTDAITGQNVRYASYWIDRFRSHLVQLNEWLVTRRDANRRVKDTLDQIARASSLSARADLIRHLLRDQLNWLPDRINPLDDSSIILLWDYEVLSLRFYASSLQGASDRAIDFADPEEHGRLYTWLVMHRDERSRPPTLDWMRRIHPETIQGNSAMPPAYEMAQTFDLPLALARRLVDPLRGDPARPVPLRGLDAPTGDMQTMPYGVYTGTVLTHAPALSSVLETIDSDQLDALYGPPRTRDRAGLSIGPVRDVVAPGQLLFTPADSETAGVPAVPVKTMRVQTGEVFPSALEIGASPPVGNLAGVVLELWFRGTRPWRDQCVGVGSQKYKVLNGQLGSATLVVRLPGTYSLWAMQLLAGERDEDGAPLVRWVLRAQVEARGAALLPVDYGRKEEHYEVNETLWPGKDFVLPKNPRTGRPFARWTRRSLDGSGVSRPVPEDEVRHLAPLPGEELSLAGLYHASEPVILEPMLAGVLATMRQQGRVADAEPITQGDVARALRLGEAQLDTKIVQNDPLDMLYLLFNGVDSTSTAARSYAESYALLSYYGTVLTADRLIQLVPPGSDTSLLLALINKVAALAIKAKTDLETELSGFNKAQRRSLLVPMQKILGRFAPAYLPLIVALFDRQTTDQSFLDVLNEHLSVFIDAVQSAVAVATATTPQLGTAEVAALVKAALAADGRTNPQLLRAVSQPAPTREQGDQFLEGLRRGRDSGPLSTAPGASAFRTTGTVPLEGTNTSSAITTLIGARHGYVHAVGGGQLVLDVTGTRNAGNSGQNDSAASLIALYRLFAPILEGTGDPRPVRITVPQLSITVRAAPSGIDVASGFHYNPSTAEWGDIRWRGSASMGGDRMLIDDDDSVGRSSGIRSRETGLELADESLTEWVLRQSSSGEPLYLTLWRGSMRSGWHAADKARLALRQLETLARRLAEAALRDTGRAFEPVDLSGPLLYRRLTALYPPIQTAPGSAPVLHPALARSGGGGDGDGHDLALDYVRTQTAVGLRTIVHQYKLPAKLLPAVATAVPNTLPERPHGAWIGRPSSWRSGPVRNKDTTGQALAHYERIVAIRKDLSLTADERAARIDAIRREPLTWNSHYVALTTLDQETRYMDQRTLANRLYRDSAGVPSARLPLPSHELASRDPYPFAAH